MKAFISKYCPKYALVLYGIAAVALIVHIFCVAFSGFADFFNIYVAGGVRFVLAKVTGILPFSLGELCLVLLPVLLIVLIVYVTHHSRKEHYDLLTRFFCAAFAFLSLFYTFFVFTLGMGYHGTALTDKLGLERKELTTGELIEVTEWLLEKTNEAAENVDFIYESSSVMPYDFNGLNEKLNEAYASVSDRFDFIMGYSSRIKPVLASKLMSSAGLLGMYSYYTGETNVNVDYPDYTLVFTCAHEMSHQRGISREDEANFMAFLLCLESDDPYINYCGYLNMFEYMLNPLYAGLSREGNTSKYSSILRKADERVLFDLDIAQKKTQENQGVISKIAEKINDTHIKVVGDEKGTASYGLVVELAAAYYYDLKADGRL